MKMLSRLFPLLAVLSGWAFAQSPTNVKQLPDCGPVFINFGALPGDTAPFDNRNLACTTWTLQIQFTGSGSVSATFQSNPDATGPGSGDWVTFPGTITNSGSNPITTSPGLTVFANGAHATPWVRVHLTGTFSGTLTGVFYGYQTNTPGSGGGGGGGCTNPCVVIGPDAPGAVSTQDPVQIAGNDGTDVRAVKTDAAGQTIPANSSQANADGISNTEATPNGAAAAALMARVLPYRFNSSTLDREYICNVQQAFTLTAGTDVVIATGVGGTVTKLCELIFSSTVVQNMTIQQGTGTTCLTNTLALSGIFQNVVTFGWDPQPTAALHTTITGRDLCMHFGGTVTSGGVAIFAQY